MLLPNVFTSLLRWHFFSLFPSFSRPLMLSPFLCLRLPCFFEAFFHHCFAGIPFPSFARPLMLSFFLCLRGLDVRHRFATAFSTPSGFVSASHKISPLPLTRCWRGALPCSVFPVRALVHLVSFASLPSLHFYCHSCARAFSPAVLVPFVFLFCVPWNLATPFDSVLAGKCCSVA